MLSFKESVHDLDTRLKDILKEMGEIYRSLESASDLSNFERERLTKIFEKEIISLTSEWTGQIQSFLDSFHKIIIQPKGIKSKFRDRKERF
jgi:hypothetical protein